MTAKKKLPPNFRQYSGITGREVKPAKKIRKAWRIGYDQPDGSRVNIEGDNNKKSVFDEIVLGEWLHIEMMNERPECYWMRLGKRVFMVFMKDGERVIREDSE